MHYHDAVPSVNTNSVANAVQYSNSNVQNCWRGYAVHAEDKLIARYAQCCSWFLAVSALALY